MEYISIIPDDVDLTQENRYLRLPHPRTGQPQLYLPYTSSGRTTILEVQKVNGTKRRTWFIGDSKIDAGTILVHHPVDPFFLIIPIILSLLSPGSTSFQPLSNLISTARSNPSFALSAPFTKSGKVDGEEGWNPDISRLLELKPVRRVFKLCCGKKVIPYKTPPPETDSPTQTESKDRKQIYYRPSLEAVLNLLRLKIESFAQHEWDKFDHLIRGLGRDGLLGDTADPELVRQAKLRSTIDHISQYLPPDLSKRLFNTYDTAALSEHLANLSAAALAASQIPTNTPKDGAGAKGAKRKVPPASRGVEMLKKVNTSSMSKLTSFFKPKEGEKKA